MGGASLQITIFVACLYAEKRIEVVQSALSWWTRVVGNTGKSKVSGRQRICP